MEVMDNVELYAVSHSGQRRDARYALEKYWDEYTWSDQDQVLDFGCGDGDTTIHLLAQNIPKFKRLVAVDVNEAMIDYAISRPEAQDPRLEFLHMDLLNESDLERFFPEGFDKVFSFYALQWVKDHRKLMEVLMQITKPGGRLLLVYPSNHQFYQVWERMAQNPTWAPYMKDVKDVIPSYHYVANETEEFAKICKSLDFEYLCTTIESNYTYQTAKDLCDAEAAVGPFLKRIPNELMDRYEADKLAEFDRICRRPDEEGEARQIFYKLTVAYLRKPA